MRDFPGAIVSDNQGIITQSNPGWHIIAGLKMNFETCAYYIEETKRTSVGCRNWKLSWGWERYQGWGILVALPYTITEKLEGFGANLKPQ